MVRTDFCPELELTAITRQKIAALRAAGFPHAHYKDRSFFKQLPHYRLLLYDDNTLLGHTGIDYRVMNLNGELIYVLGVIDLVIHPDFQRRGYGTILLQELHKIAPQHVHHVDFIFLVTDQPAFYQRLGYQPTAITTTWLKLHKDRTYDVGKETITDSTFMYLPISGKIWKDGELDLMGYMY